MDDRWRLGNTSKTRGTRQLLLQRRTEEHSQKFHGIQHATDKPPSQNQIMSEKRSRDTVTPLTFIRQVHRHTGVWPTELNVHRGDKGFQAVYDTAIDASIPYAQLHDACEEVCRKAARKRNRSPPPPPPPSPKHTLWTAHELLPSLDETIDAWKHVLSMTEDDLYEQVEQQPPEEGEEPSNPWGVLEDFQCTLVARLVRQAMRQRGVEYTLPFETHKCHLWQDYTHYKKLAEI